MQTTGVNRFRAVFASRHVVLPVIHVATQAQALRNAAVAREAGADGCFLINHSIGSKELLAIHAAVADANPGWWVGVNCLDLDAEEVFERLSPSVSGV